MADTLLDTPATPPPPHHAPGAPNTAHGTAGGGGAAGGSDSVAVLSGVYHGKRGGAGSHPVLASAPLSPGTAATGGAAAGDGGDGSSSSSPGGGAAGAAAPAAVIVSALDDKLVVGVQQCAGSGHGGAGGAAAGGGGGCLARATRTYTLPWYYNTPVAYCVKHAVEAPAAAGVDSKFRLCMECQQYQPLQDFAVNVSPAAAAAAANSGNTIALAAAAGNNTICRGCMYPDAPLLPLRASTATGSSGIMNNVVASTALVGDMMAPAPQLSPLPSPTPTPLSASAQGAGVEQEAGAGAAGVPVTAARDYLQAVLGNSCRLGPPERTTTNVDGTEWIRFPILPLQWPRGYNLSDVALWTVGYHGTSWDRLAKMVQYGLYCPSTPAPRGVVTTLARRSVKDDHVWISPSLPYAALFAEANKTPAGSWVALLELKVNPSATRAGPSRVPWFATAALDPTVVPHQIEWQVLHPHLALPTAILLTRGPAHPFAPLQQYSQTMDCLWFHVHNATDFPEDLRSVIRALPVEDQVAWLRPIATVINAKANGEFPTIESVKPAFIEALRSKLPGNTPGSGKEGDGGASLILLSLAAAAASTNPSAAGGPAASPPPTSTDAPRGKRGHAAGSANGAAGAVVPVAMPLATTSVSATSGLVAAASLSRCSLPGCDAVVERPGTFYSVVGPLRLCVRHCSEGFVIPTESGEPIVYRACRRGHHVVTADNFERGGRTCSKCRQSALRPSVTSVHVILDANGKAIRFEPAVLPLSMPWKAGLRVVFLLSGLTPWFVVDSKQLQPMASGHTQVSLPVEQLAKPMLHDAKCVVVWEGQQPTKESPAVSFIPSFHSVQPARTRGEGRTPTPKRPRVAAWANVPPSQSGGGSSPTATTPTGMGTDGLVPEST